MSGVQPKEDGGTCILCFWAKRKCGVGGKPCCSQARSHEVPCIGVDNLDSRIITQLRGWSEAQQTGLAFIMQSHYMLKCQPRSNLDTGTSDVFTLGGPFNVSNPDLVAQLDRMVLDIWAPKIQAKDGAINSISLACLGIGYCNMLIFADMQDNSEPPFDRHGLSPIFAELAIMRVNDLIANVMNLVRGVHYEMDAESRPWLILWYLYLSIMHAELPKLGRCLLFDNVELFEHLQEIFASFRKELGALLAKDCKNKVDWVGAFEDSQRGLVRKLRSTVSRVLSMEWVSWPAPPSHLVHYKPPQLYQTSIQPQGTTFIDHQIDSRPNKTLNTPSFEPTWTGLNANTSPMAIPGLTHNTRPSFSASTNETACLGFNQNIDPLANQYDFTPCGLQHHGSGDYNTLS